MENTVKKRDIWTSSLETEADTGPQEKKKDDIVDECELAALSILNKKRGTAMY